MKRIIVGFEKLTPEISTLLLQKYPDGFSDDDIIAFKNPFFGKYENFTQYIIKIIECLGSK